MYACTLWVCLSSQWNISHRVLQIPSHPYFPDLCTAIAHKQVHVQYSAIHYLIREMLKFHHRIQYSASVCERALMHNSVHTFCFVEIQGDYSNVCISEWVSLSHTRTHPHFRNKISSHFIKKWRSSLCRHRLSLCVCVWERHTHVLTASSLVLIRTSHFVSFHLISLFLSAALQSPPPAAAANYHQSY